MSVEWPKTTEPRRIAIMGWARLSLQAREGSGYNYSASELAKGLARSGHHVFYLRSGMDYSIRPGIRTRHHETWEGIECHDLVNGPNLSPSFFNFDAPLADVEQPRLVKAILTWLDAHRIELVHIHSMEGLSTDLIGAIRRTDRPVLVTLHNYSVVCPQVDLLREEKSVCMDYDGGRACVGCLKPPARRFERTKRRVEQLIRATLGGEGESFIRHCIHVAKVLKTRRRRATPYVRDPDPEIGLGFEVDDASSHSGEIGHNHYLTDNEIAVTLGRAPADQNERFLRADHHLTVLNDYGTRRVKGIEALNEASLVTPPSRFLLDVHQAMGLLPERSRHVRLGQPHFDQINRRARRSPYYDVRPWSPGDTRACRFGFWGTTRNNKGLEILVSAIPLLDRDVRRQCQFLIRAGGWEWAFRKRLSKFPEVQFAGGYDELQLIAGGGEYDVGILPHVWFENSPLVLLEHLHAGKFVIASRLGGPPEWIREPTDDHRGNGLLFPGGCPEELAARITRIIEGDVTLPTPREVHRASILRSYPDHVREYDAVYQALLRGETPPPEAVDHAPDVTPVVRTASRVDEVS